MDFFKSIDKSLLIICGAAAAVGLLVLIWPAAIMRLICFIIALLLVAVGVLRIMTYTKEARVSKFAKTPNLAVGLFLVMAGVIFAFESGMLVVIMPFVLCLVIWFGTFYLLQKAVNSFMKKGIDWWVQAIMAFVALIFAIIVSTKLGSNMLATLGALEAVSTMWLTGLAMIIIAIEVIVSSIVPELMAKKD